MIGSEDSGDRRPLGMAQCGAARPPRPAHRGPRSPPYSSSSSPAAARDSGSGGCWSASKHRREAMTCSGRCWRRRLVVLAIVASLPSGCGTVGSDQPLAAACPPVVTYDAELQSRAAAEVEALPDGSAVAGLLSDYAVMRDQARACNKRVAPADRSAPFGFISACRPPPQPRGAMASSVLSAPGWPSVAAGAARALVVLGDDELPSCLRPIPGLARHAQQEDLMRTEVEVLNNDPPPRLGCFGKVLRRVRATAH